MIQTKEQYLNKDAPEEVERLPSDYQSYLDADPAYEAWANEYRREIESALFIEQDSLEGRQHQRKEARR